MTPRKVTVEVNAVPVNAEREFAQRAADQGGRTFDPMTPVRANEYFKDELKRLTDIARLIKLQPE